jgi:hypothetical protein
MHKMRARIEIAADCEDLKHTSDILMDLKANFMTPAMEAARRGAPVLSGL